MLQYVTPQGTITAKFAHPDVIVSAGSSDPPQLAISITDIAGVALEGIQLPLVRCSFYRLEIRREDGSVV